LPPKIEAKEFENILKHCRMLGLDESVMKEWYIKNGNEYAIDKRKGW
jgi:hypothetical protein